MQRDDGLEMKLQQLKKAYEQQPKMTNTEQLVSRIYNQGEMHKVRRKRRFLPAITAVAVAAIIGVLIVATPELLEAPQNAAENNESIQIQDNKESVITLEKNAFNVDREPSKVETIDIEGMPEELTFNLAQNEQLQISTYYPDDMIVETKNDTLSFYANFGGNKDESAYVEIYGVEKEKTSVENMLASFSNYEITKKQQADFFVPLSEEEYMVINGDLVGVISLFEQNEKLFRITIHYPAEYGDGIDPRASKIISELQFH